MYQPNRCGQRPRVRPAADLVEREDGFYLYLDLPGVPKENLVVDLEDNELTITATTAHAVCQNERVHVMEFGDVEYRAQFTLADLVDKQHIGAQLANGILTVFMPKRTEEKPRRIKIEVV